MGDVPDLFYDRPKAGDLRPWKEEVREFALKYFMRISSFRQPQSVKDAAVGDARTWPIFDAISLCRHGYIEREGFGYQQLLYKLLNDDTVRRFPKSEQRAIVDVRELETKYEWIVVAVRIFDFDLVYPENPSLPRLSLPLRETAYVVLHRAFVSAQDVSEGGIVSKYRFGYAMLRPFTPSLLAYGPGQFTDGFQLFEFTVKQNEEIRVRMPFVVNRPDRILNVSVDPLDWSFRTLEILTKNRIAPLLSPWKKLSRALPGRGLTFDPVLTSISLLNVFSLGQAQKRLCISKEQLEKIMLIFHFNQYYKMLTGSLLTWRQVANWLDEDNLPAWIRYGQSS
jgi:hypothetical protein